MLGEDYESFSVSNLSEPIEIAVPQTTVITPDKVNLTLTAKKFRVLEVNTNDEDSSLIIHVENNRTMVDIEILVKKGAKPSLDDNDRNATLSVTNGTTYKYLLKTRELAPNDSAIGTYFIGLRYKVPVNPSSNWSLSTDSIEVVISIFEASGLYWKKTDNTWSSEGCEVSG